MNDEIQTNLLKTPIKLELNYGQIKIIINQKLYIKCCCYMCL